jgi:hypothetical protein
MPDPTLVHAVTIMTNAYTAPVAAVRIVDVAIAANTQMVWIVALRLAGFLRSHAALLCISNVFAP